jgi:uncharacterized membrane protein YfcA
VKSTTRRSLVTGIFIGVGAGLASGLLGVGGGIVMVPLLVAILGFSQHEAHATSLAAIVLLGLAGALTYAAQGNVDLRVAALLAAGSLIGVPLGARVMAQSSEGLLKAMFGALMIAVAIELLVGQPVPGASPTKLTVGLASITAAAGVVVGVLSALFGVGGGVVMVPFMVLVLDKTQHLAQGTSLVVIVPTAIAGVMAHSRRGYVSFSYGAMMAIGGIPAGFVGATIAQEIPARTLTTGFGVVLAALGVRRIIQGTRRLRSPDM